MEAGLGSSDYNKYLSVFQLEEFRNILVKYTDPKYVKNHNAHSIWVDSVLISIMKEQLEKLDLFISLMKQTSGLKIFFYDSY